MREVHQSDEIKKFLGRYVIVILRSGEEIEGKLARDTLKNREAFCCMNSRYKYVFFQNDVDRIITFK